MPFDLFTSFSELLANGTASGIDIATPCYSFPPNEEFGSPTDRQGTVCADPTQHIFWDSVHPTGWVHRQMGEAIAEYLGGMGITTF